MGPFFFQECVWGGREEAADNWRLATFFFLFLFFFFFLLGGEGCGRIPEILLSAGKIINVDLERRTKMQSKLLEQYAG